VSSRKEGLKPYAGETLEKTLGLLDKALSVEAAKDVSAQVKQRLASGAAAGSRTARQRWPDTCGSWHHSFYCRYYFYSIKAGCKIGNFYVPHFNYHDRFSGT
jgi:hypothetical protein